MEKEIKIIKVENMENIKNLATRMLELAKQGYIVKTVFNDIPLTTENANSVKDILNQRDDYDQKQYELYINSPQYEIDKEKAKKKELEEKEKKKELEDKAKKKELEEKEKTQILLQEFRNLDLKSVSDIVNWIGKMANCKNDIFANKFEVLPMLEESGYQTLKDDFDKDINMTAEEYIKFAENLDEVGNYIISLAISDMDDFCTISGSMNYFVQLYEQRLNEQDKTDDNFSIRRK